MKYDRKRSCIYIYIYAGLFSILSACIRKCSPKGANCWPWSATRNA